MPDPTAPRSRPERVIATVQRWGASGWERVRGALRNPVRLLIGALVVVLVVLSVPLVVGSASRLDRIWKEWRHETTVSSDWTRTIATIRGVRTDAGLDLDLAFWDRGGHRHRAEVRIDSPGSEWIRSTLPIRYDPRDPSQVDVVGFTNGHPLGQALETGAALGGRHRGRDARTRDLAAPRAARVHRPSVPRCCARRSRCRARCSRSGSPRGPSAP